MKTTIEMAREAAGDDWKLFQEYMPEIHRLVELVRADERARMAEQPAQQEPVAWMYQCSAGSSGPVLTQHKKDWAESGSGLWTETALYTTPQPPAQQESEAAAVHGHTFKAVPSPETIEFITAFAELVRADEREKYKWDVHSCGPTCKRYACVAMREAVEAEREECAKVCDDLHPGLATKRSAEIIRARGSNT
jgi:hypothetical protein